MSCFDYCFVWDESFGLRVQWATSWNCACCSINYEGLSLVYAFVLV